MYPHSVIGFGFAIRGFKLFAHMEAKAFKTKLCVHPSCGVALPKRKVSAQVGFSEPGKLDGPFIKCCSLLWTERACHQMLLHAKFPPRSKTTPPCLQTWHPRSEPSARKLSPDRAKIRLQQAGPRNKTKRVLGAQKWGQAFLPDFNCWANWWTQFWVQISTPEMGPQYVKKRHQPLV